LNLSPSLSSPAAEANALLGSSDWYVCLWRAGGGEGANKSARRPRPSEVGEESGDEKSGRDATRGAMLAGTEAASGGSLGATSASVENAAAKDA
jgi:hypothetical protein